MRIWFVRHGETEWNRTKRYQGHSDIPLNETGRRQAQETAALLANEPLMAVYASDLKRAVETAETIAQPHGVRVQQKPELRELHFGLWEGLRYEQIMEKWADELSLMYEHPEKGCAPEGEGFCELAKRAWPALQAIREAHQEEEAIAVVAHGGTIRVLLCLLQEKSLQQLWDVAIEHGQATRIDV
ncbi:MAG: alpha-ribazole phosphatase [Negativicutes bacterium]|nr:alpha-ribazole phosphatase [Negativicutes bacterium]